MSEVAFAKSFLTTLDKRPIKLPGDHVSDPRKLPNASPFVLPKQTLPFPRRGPAVTQQAQPKSITVSLKPMRAGETVRLPDISLDASVHDIKTQYASEAGLALDKIKILLNKKPAADLKTLKDLGVEQDVEFSVMVMGGGGIQTPTASASPQLEKSETAAMAAAPPAPESEKAHAEAELQQNSTSAQDSVREILGSDEFWLDVKGFLAQRLRHQEEGERLARVFREAAGR